MERKPMLRIIAILFGIGFIFAGVAGFLPQFISDGLLFGLFEVNTMHNIVHLVSGVLAIMAATSYKYAKLYFQIFGVIYAIVAIVGFWKGGDLYIMHMNMADNILHTGIAVIALYLGFSTKKVA
jgi:hypothetical protein